MAGAVATLVERRAAALLGVADDGPQGAVGIDPVVASKPALAADDRRCPSAPMTRSKERSPAVSVRTTTPRSSGRTAVTVTPAARTPARRVRWTSRAGSISTVWPRPRPRPRATSTGSGGASRPGSCRLPVSRSWAARHTGSRRRQGRHRTSSRPPRPSRSRRPGGSPSSPLLASVRNGDARDVPAALLYAEGDVSTRVSTSDWRAGSPGSARPTWCGPPDGSR